MNEKKRQIQTHECDVLVIGGGIAGMEAALRVVSQGKTAIIVDKDIEIFFLQQGTTDFFRALSADSQCCE